MSITVVTDETATPPTNTITVDAGAGSVMSSVSLWRDDPGGRVLVRTQPSAGFASQTVVDVECPFEAATTYEWSAVYSTGLTTLWDETWANISAWTVGEGAWSVSGGTVTNTSIGGDFEADLSRSFATAYYRVVIASLASAGTGKVILHSAATSSDIVTLRVVGTALKVSPQNGSEISTSIDPSQPITVDISDGHVVVQGTGGSTVVQTLKVGATLDQIQIYTSKIGGVVVGEIKVSAYSTALTIAETSDPATVSPADGWLIHPIVPSLSFKLDLSGNRTATIRDIDDITNRSNATSHDILGSKTPITTVTGPRYDDELGLTIATTTAAERTALKALLNDQTPILISIPPSKGVELDYGFYQVGDTTIARRAQTPNFPARDYVLPLTKTQSPIASVINTGWTYAALLLAYANYDTIKSAYDTYADLAADNRNPGF